jgi:hypothetical protein
VAAPVGRFCRAEFPTEHIIKVSAGFSFHNRVLFKITCRADFKKRFLSRNPVPADKTSFFLPLPSTLRSPTPSANAFDFVGDAVLRAFSF